MQVTVGRLPHLALRLMAGVAEAEREDPCCSARSIFSSSIVAPQTTAASPIRSNSAGHCRRFGWTCRMTELIARCIADRSAFLAAAAPRTSSTARSEWAVAEAIARERYHGTLWGFSKTSHVEPSNRTSLREAITHKTPSFASTVATPSRPNLSLSKSRCGPFSPSS